MRDEYKTIIFSYLAMLGFMTICFLVMDLFKDGAFASGMIGSLGAIGILIAISLSFKAFRLNYKVTKRN